MRGSLSKLIQISTSGPDLICISSSDEDSTDIPQQHHYENISSITGTGFNNIDTTMTGGPQLSNNYIPHQLWQSTTQLNSSNNSSINNSFYNCDFVNTNFNLNLNVGNIPETVYSTTSGNGWSHHQHLTNNQNNNGTEQLRNNFGTDTKTEASIWREWEQYPNSTIVSENINRTGPTQTLGISSQSWGQNNNNYENNWKSSDGEIDTLTQTVTSTQTTRWGLEMKNPSFVSTNSDAIITPNSAFVAYETASNNSHIGQSRLGLPENLPISTQSITSANTDYTTHYQPLAPTSKNVHQSIGNFQSRNELPTVSENNPYGTSNRNIYGQTSSTLMGERNSHKDIYNKDIYNLLREHLPQRAYSQPNRYLDILDYQQPKQRTGKYDDYVPPPLTLGANFNNASIHSKEQINQIQNQEIISMQNYMVGYLDREQRSPLSSLLSKNNIQNHLPHQNQILNPPNNYSNILEQNQSENASAKLQSLDFGSSSTQNRRQKFTSTFSAPNISSSSYSKLNCSLLSKNNMQNHLPHQNQILNPPNNYSNILEQNQIENSSAKLHDAGDGEHSFLPVRQRKVASCTITSSSNRTPEQFSTLSSKNNVQNHLPHQNVSNPHNYSNGWDQNQKCSISSDNGVQSLLSRSSTQNSLHKSASTSSTSIILNSSYPEMYSSTLSKNNMQNDLPQQNQTVVNTTNTLEQNQTEITRTKLNEVASSPYVPNITISSSIFEPDSDEETENDDNIVVNKITLITTLENTQCSFCPLELAPGDGIVLRSCLHNFCRECIVFAVLNSEASQISCPVAAETDCKGVLLDPEVKQLISPVDYEKYIRRSIEAAEKELEDVFTCRNSSCMAAFSIVKHSQEFQCPQCGKTNCFICKGVKEGGLCNCRKRPMGGVYAPQKVTKVDHELRKDFESNWSHVAESVAVPSTSSGEGTTMNDILIEMEEHDLLLSTKEFNCTICLCDILPGEGVILKECFHIFCKVCLTGTIEHCDNAEVNCPFQKNDYSCQSTVSDREIKALLSKESYDKFLSRSVNQAEMSIANSFHCKTVNCTAWCEFEDGAPTFICPICNRINCLKCKSIHEEISCIEYQDKLREDEMDHGSKSLVQNLIRTGKAMKCPTCRIVIQKTEGCDGMKCTVCKTSICWATKGPRWGPRGYGDTSAGCRCGVNGKKCNPNCHYCH